MLSLPLLPYQFFHSTPTPSANISWSQNPRWWPNTKMCTRVHKICLQALLMVLLSLSSALVSNRFHTLGWFNVLNTGWFKLGLLLHVTPDNYVFTVKCFKCQLLYEIMSLFSQRRGGISKRR